MSFITNFNFSPIPLTPFNWSDLISGATVKQHLNSPTWKTIQKIPDIRISTLQASSADADDDDWLMDTSPMSWWPGVVIILLLLGGGALLALAYHRRWSRSKPNFPFRTHSTPRSGPLAEPIEMSSITAAECVTMLQEHADVIASPPP